MWSCLVTIFSCTWVAVHPNIPCPKTRKANSCIERWIWNPLLSFAEHRLPLFVCALLVPEYVLGWAVRQFWRARQIVDENKCEFEILGHVFINSLLDRRWSMAHGFFIIMGGLHLFKHNSEEKCDAQSISPEDDDPLHPLLAEDLIRDSIYSFTMLTEAEIKDKGKSDSLAKSLVLLQTSWFVMQCIARAIEHLPVTHLEIVTLAYAAMNFMIYIFWWNKPLNVNQPVRVFRKSESSEIPQEWVLGARKLTWKTIGTNFILGFQDEDVILSRRDRVPRFWANSTSAGEGIGIADGIVLVVGICFGAIHCTAWCFSFPTHTELLMWRISSVAMTAVPFCIPVMIALGILLDSGRIIVVFSIFAGILYIIARAVTLVLVFTSLRELPHGAYETVYWTTLIPHI